jgi:hypothetical protein
MKKVNSDKPSKQESWKKIIRSTIILEIIGKPKEHLVKTLEDIIKQINEEQGVCVTGKKINEPVLMKDTKELYTTFAEVELEIEDILYLAVIMFKYMPAHIEVISPELIALTNNGWTDILSELTRRLHSYEEIARIMQIQNSKIQNKLKELISKSNQNSPNTVASPKELLSEKNKTENKSTDKEKTPKEEKK